MASDIRTWEIVDGQLLPIDARLADHGRTEAFDLEAWIESDPSIIRAGLKVIGRQVRTRSGPLDLLAIDRTGDVVVIELKRDRLPREALAQVIDYAADIATWSLDRLSEVCTTYSDGRTLDELFSEAFPDVDLESVTINGSQRIVLVGFSVEPSLERMIEWLSESYGMAVNAVVLKYVRTARGSEVLARSAVISEQEEEVRSKERKFSVPMSDDPGDYDLAELRDRLRAYLSRDLVSVRWIREHLLPACLEKDLVTREELTSRLVQRAESEDARSVGLAFTSVSVQLGRKENDFLRQVLGYSYPNHPWEKDEFFVRPGYRGLVEELLKQLGVLG